ncbi:MAG: YegS/Rv2252/BmrU family lipid kinase [Lachnospiraceae bacterium]|nr:YegS/Rv2252/BmrU family lipid kinase [Lachnospiraceae bacterium]
MKKLLFVLNSVSGKALLTKRFYEITEYFTQKGYMVTACPVNPVKNLGTDSLSESFISEFDIIVAGGGDGTLNHVINQLMECEKRPVLGYIPAGSTNDFAKGMKIDSSVKRSCRIITDGTPFAYDIGSFNKSYFNYIAAFGAFSAISYDTDQQMKNALGYAAYIINGIAELPQNLAYKCHMKIKADSFEEEGDYIFGAICNTISVGGMNIFGDSDVRLDDGYMEMLLIKAPDNITEAPDIINALTNGNWDNSHITFKQIKEVRIVSNEKTSWTVDGEFGGSLKQVDIKVLGGAITIMSGHKPQKRPRITG